MFNHLKLAEKIAAGDFSVVLNCQKCNAVSSGEGAGTLGSIAWKINSLQTKGYTMFSLTLTNTDNYYTDVDVGDIVLYAKYAGTEVKIDGVNYILLDIDSVYSVKE